MSERKIIRVRDVMRAEFDLVDGLTTVSEALKTLHTIENKMLIVEKRHQDDEYGVVMVSDIARHVLAQDKSPERVNVYEIMTKPALTVEAKMDVRYCARLFDKFGITRAPVMENGMIVGVVDLTMMVLKGIRLDA